MVVALPFIQTREGTKLTAYQDIANVWTICSGVAYVPKGTVYTEAQCTDLDRETIGKHMKQVASELKVPVSAKTLAALTSFHYNIGDAGFRRSTTLRYFNNNEPEGGCRAMILWNKVGNRVSAGIVNRRQAEIKLCLAGLND